MCFLLLFLDLVLFLCLFIFSYFLITGKTKLDKIKMRRPFESFVSYKMMILLKIVSRQKVRAYEVAVYAAQPKNSEPLCDFLALID